MKVLCGLTREYAELSFRFGLGDERGWAGWETVAISVKKICGVLTRKVTDLIKANCLCYKWRVANWKTREIPVHELCIQT